MIWRAGTSLARMVTEVDESGVISLVELVEALAHPCWEAKRLLGMAKKWASRDESPQ